MKKLDAISKTSFKEGAYHFYQDFIVKTVFNDVQREEYKNASDAYNHCFFLAKENKSEAAKKAYTVCCALKKKLDPFVAQWIAALYEPRLSYYHYKTQDYQMAISVTGEIILANRILQEQGYQYLFFSEMQQVHNLSRIYFKLGQTSHAISICIKSLINMYECSDRWTLGRMIGGIPEDDIIADSQYAMIVQIMTETFIRILRTFQSDSISVYYWLEQFVIPLSEIKFSSISKDIHYQFVDALTSFLKGMVLNRNIIDYENLLLVEKINVDKLLLGVVCEYITFWINENEKSLNVDHSCLSN